MSELFVISPSLPRCGGQTLMNALSILLKKTVWHSVENDKFDYVRPHDGGMVEAIQPLRYLLAKFPHAKFIYLVREKSDWLASCERLYRQARQLNYNNPVWQLAPDMFPYYYDEHLLAWSRFALELPGDQTMSWNLTGHPGWKPLCTFLGLDDPGVAFPNVDHHGRTVCVPEFDL